MTKSRPEPIQLDSHLHRVGEQVNLPYQVKRGLAWWIAAEMIRRHPDELRVIETHPGGGQYDCLSLYRRGKGADLVAHMNLVGHITHAAWFDEPGSIRNSEVEDPRFNWLDVLAAEDRRKSVVEQLERASGLFVPSETPRTTSRSIGPRVIARFANAAALSTKSWEIRNGVFDTSGIGGGVNKWVREIAGPYYERHASDFLEEPHYRYWFVLDHRDGAVAAIDVDRGLAWRRGESTEGQSLMHLYTGCGSWVDSVTATVLPAVE